MDNEWYDFYMKSCVFCLAIEFLYILKKINIYKAQ